MIKVLVSTSSIDELTASSVLTFAPSVALGLMIRASKFDGVSAPKPEEYFTLIQHSLAQNAATMSWYIGMICLLCMLICFLVFVVHIVLEPPKQPGVQQFSGAAQQLSGTKTRIAIVTMYVSSYIAMMASISAGICFLIFRI